MDAVGVQKERLFECACFIVDVILSRYLGETGLPVKFVDTSTGAILSKETFIEDFGDYVQNVAWVGIKTGRREYVDWAVNQIVLGSELAQSSQGYFYTRVSDQKDVQGSRIVHVNENADTLEGISTTYAITQNQKILQIGERLISFLQSFVDSRGFVKRGLFISPLLNVEVPIPMALPAYHGNFAEELVVLHRLLDRKDYLDLAGQMIQPWLECEYFKKVGFFPNKLLTAWDNKYSRAGMDVLLRIASKLMRRHVGYMATTEMAKTNTNLVSAILEHYAVSRQPELKTAVYKWCHSVESKLLEGGFFYGLWDEATQRRSIGVRPLGQNHPILNIYVDSYRLFEDEYFLNIAERCAEFWLEHQSPLGLFPVNPLGQDNQARRACLDPQTDLMVVLLKLYGLTHDDKYLDSVIRCLNAILHYYCTPYGLVWSVHSDTGEIVTARQHVKFLTLFLKIVMGLSEVLDGNDIYDDYNLYLLSRDR